MAKGGGQMLHIRFYRLLQTTTPSPNSPTPTCFSLPTHRFRRYPPHQRRSHPIHWGAKVMAVVPATQVDVRLKFSSRFLLRSICRHLPSAVI